MLSILAACFNVLIAILLPLGALLYCAVRKRRLVLPFLAGAATFLVSQTFTRVPLLGLLQGQLWFKLFSLQHPALFSILLGLSAGLFEEVGRYIAMWLLKRHHGTAEGIAFGLGHGGIEAALYGGIQSLQALLFQQGALLLSPPLYVALTGIERTMAITVHVCFSVLVMRAVRYKKPLWLLWAMLLHGGLDAGLGLLPLWFGTGVIGIEIYVALAAVAIVLFTVFTRPRPLGPAPTQGGLI